MLRLRDHYSHHVAAEHLCRKLCEIAVLEFGEQAESQLSAWNIRTTFDLGQIVFALVAVELLTTRVLGSILSKCPSLDRAPKRRSRSGDV